MLGFLYMHNLNKQTVNNYFLIRRHPHKSKLRIKVETFIWNYPSPFNDYYIAFPLFFIWLCWKGKTLSFPQLCFWKRPRVAANRSNNPNTYFQLNGKAILLPNVQSSSIYRKSLFLFSLTTEKVCECLNIPNIPFITVFVKSDILWERG